MQKENEQTAKTFYWPPHKMNKTNYTSNGPRTEIRCPHCNKYFDIDKNILELFIKNAHKDKK